MKKIFLTTLAALFCLTAMPQLASAARHPEIPNNVEYKHWSKRLQKWQYLSCTVQYNQVKPSTCKVVHRG
ncbi:MAG: hypothetical protein V4691_06590 [Pseudomonadota bacterium]